MGNVLMAARYAEAPEPFYLNAQALAPDDGRWPYYLGHLYTTQGAFERAAAVPSTRPSRCSPTMCRR